MAKFEIFKDLILLCGAILSTQGVLFNLIGCYAAVTLSTVKLVGLNYGLVEEGILPQNDDNPPNSLSKMPIF